MPGALLQPARAGTALHVPAQSPATRREESVGSREFAVGRHTGSGHGDQCRHPVTPRSATKLEMGLQLGTTPASPFGPGDKEVKWQPGTMTGIHPAALQPSSFAPRLPRGVFISLPPPELGPAPIREPCWHGSHWESFNPAAVNLPPGGTGGLTPGSDGCLPASPRRCPSSA